jgi:serine acetyltransferase/glycosyltransferase involved in cell wall biosynthesis
MQDFIKYILQDWQVNKGTSFKSRLILLMFRTAQIMNGVPKIFKIISSFYRFFYQIVVEYIFGVEIPASVLIGSNLQLHHPHAIVINNQTIIGANCILRHSTTIGNKKLPDGSYSNSPKIGNNVEIGTNVVIIGDITVGDNAVIGAGSIVVKDVPAGAIVAGNPAKIIRMNNKEEKKEQKEEGRNIPRVSVIVPAYNSMKYLPETLESILQQTFQDFEVLIINDGSSDNIVEWFSQIEDPRVKLISQTNKGLSSARNTGIANSQGEYIALLDSDDTWEKTKLEKQVNYLDQNPSVDVVHTWIKLIDEKGKSTGRILKSYAQGNIFREIIQQNVIACLSVIARRCCFESVRGFDENLRSLEDWDIWIRIAKDYKFAVIPESLANYRQIPTSLSKNYQLIEQSFHTVIEKTFNIVPTDLLDLKNNSYGYAYICISWKALQSEAQDIKQASLSHSLALQHNPKLRFTREYIRLSLAIFITRYLGVNSYGKFLEFAYSIRRYFSNLVYNIK